MIQTDLKRLGYTKEEIKKMLNTYPLSSLSEEKIKKNVNELFYYFIDYGFTVEEIRYITLECPLYGYLKSNIVDKNKYLEKIGFTNKEIIRIALKFSNLYECSVIKLNDTITFLEKMGFTINQIRTMILNHSAILSYNIDKMMKNFVLVKSYGFENRDVLRMFYELPTLFGLSYENIKQKMDFYKQNDIMFVPLLKPKYLIQSVSLTNARLMFLKSRGFNMTENNMTVLYMSNDNFLKTYKITKEALLKLYPLDDTNNIVHQNNNKSLVITDDLIDKKAKELESIGYGYIESLKILKIVPIIYSFSIEKILTKIYFLTLLGYSYDDVIKMTSLCPSLFVESSSNLKEKIEYLKELNLGFIPIVSVRCVMQSIYLTHSRVMFFKERNIILNENNYNKLFLSQAEFYKKYHVTSMELLEKYDYDEYLKKKQKQEITRSLIDD